MMMSRSVRVLLVAVCLCLLVVASESSAAAPLDGTKPAHWRVTWAEEPSTQATVSWSTAQPGRTHAVRFRVRGQNGSEAVRTAENGRFTGETELYYHHARLTELEPSTAYEVQMVSDDEVSPVFYFVTAPADDRPLSFIHGGDSRTGHEDRRAINQEMAKAVTASFANDDPADDIVAFAHGGDYIVNGTNVEQWSAWLSDHELTVGPDGRLLPVIPTRGNHDLGKPYNEVFGFAENDKNYFATSITPQIRLVTLNTEIATSGNQADWLDAELAASRPKYRWLLAQYHRPAFPAVKTPGTALQSWVPLFEKYNVDLVAESDGHAIKRTVPVRAGKLDETGVVYIGEGGLGVPQRTPKPDRWFLQPPGFAGAGHHYFIITCDGEQITSKCMLLDGSVRDEYSRSKR